MGRKFRTTFKLILSNSTFEHLTWTLINNSCDHVYVDFFHAGYEIKSLETVENTNNLIKSLAFSLKKEVYKNNSKNFPL